MNKKTIIIIVSVIAALAIATTATIAILSSKLGGNSDKKDDKNNVTSSENSKEDNKDTESAPIVDGSASQDGTTNNDGGNTETDDAAISIPAAPNDITTFIGGNVEAEKGGKVKVPVFVSSNKGFVAVFAQFQYDTSVLKYTGYKKGNLLSEYDFHTENDVIKFIGFQNQKVTKDGILLYLEFDVIAENATKTPIKIIVEDNGVAASSEQYLKTETVDGSVTIK